MPSRRTTSRAMSGCDAPLNTLMLAIERGAPPDPFDPLSRDGRAARCSTVVITIAARPLASPSHGNGVIGCRFVSILPRRYVDATFDISTRRLTFKQTRNKTKNTRTYAAHVIGGIDRPRCSVTYVRYQYITIYGRVLLFAKGSGANVAWRETYNTYNQ